MCSHQLSVPLAGLGPLTMIDLSASGHHIQTLGSEFPSFADQGITGEGNACWWNVSARGDNDDIIEIFTGTIVFMYALDYVTQYQKHLDSCVTLFLFFCQVFPLKLTLTLTIKSVETRINCANM